MTVTAAPEPDWELDQLAALAAAALAAASVAQPNGQVQAAPDRRTIRWYQSLGIVDPPRRVGRSARYGPRQLAQVVAMKRLQAGGVSVEEAGRRMAGLDEAALQQLAALPEGLALSDPAPARPFWRQDPALPAAQPAPRPAGPTALAQRAAVELTEGVTLILSPARPPTPADAAAVVALLRTRGLLPPTTDPAEPAHLTETEIR